ncbi:MAG TPA: hypothetical protein DDY18_06180 [Flavobacterium sp.]|jgi:hypothetical protein|nr:hypothetical protein [Flavobacterium sp.]
MELGKAKYGSGKTVFKIQDGDNVYRILPPMGKLAKQGKWYEYYRVEWGYKNSAGKNRPFQDVRKVNYQNKMVEVESDAHLRREALKAEKDALVKTLRANPQDAAALARAKTVTEELKRYNLDAKYYLNAIDLQGKIGLLKIGSRAFKLLKTQIEDLRKTGVDPLSIENGRFFNFNRSNPTGNFNDTAYQVTVYQENVQINGKTYKEDKVHVIDQSIIDRLSDEAYELSGMYPVLTAIQVSQIVKEGATAVDRLLGAGNETASDDDGGDDEETTQSTPVIASQQVPTQTMTTQPPVVQQAVAQAVPTTETLVATKTEIPAAPPKGEVSVDQFLKSIGALSS